MRELFLATSNVNKVKEFQRILMTPVKQLEVSLMEVQSLDVAEVIGEKARDAFTKTHGVPVLVEDTGLHIDAWNGLPGALITWFMQTVKPTGICKMMTGEENRDAEAISVIGIYDGRDTHTFIGRLRGTVAARPVGDNGFGWDSIFIPDGQTLTLAQLAHEEKDRLSMRKAALMKFQSAMGSLGL